MIASGQIEPAVYQQATMIGKIKNSHNVEINKRKKQNRRGKVRLTIYKGQITILTINSLH